MPSRRDLLRLTALAGVSPLLPACGASGYDEAVAETWRHAPAVPTEPLPLLRELVRYATLAANSHNTQPWRFALDGSTIVIQPDLSRRTPAVDPDDHHLWVSLGCAAENLVLAAAAFGRRAEIEFDARAVDQQQHLHAGSAGGGGQRAQFGRRQRLAVVLGARALPPRNCGEQRRAHRGHRRERRAHRA